MIKYLDISWYDFSHKENLFQTTNILNKSIWQFKYYLISLFFNLKLIYDILYKSFVIDHFMVHSSLIKDSNKQERKI